MPQTINTNIMSLNAQRNLNANQTALATTVQRLSSGLRVNSAKDDAAGLAIAERMNAQVKGMNVAIRNANDGVSLAQTAEGVLGKMTEMLQRMRELAVQASSDSYSSQDKASLNEEFTQLQTEIQRLINGTSFNQRYLFKPDSNGATQLTFQVGPGSSSDNSVSIAFTDLTSTTSTTVGSIAEVLDSNSYSIGSGNAAQALGAIDNALDQVNSQRASYGALQNRFDAIISNLSVTAENVAAARARIMDADYAQETANLTRTQILQQAGVSMVAQANQLPQQVLQLLKGG